jgi:hypothetical protein
MYSRDLTQQEIEALDAESYSNFLAFGDGLKPEPDGWEQEIMNGNQEYEEWLAMHRMYDL